MQVLVALHRAEGAVVSKDDLAQSCWEGRVVGEDAINRVISRLRKVGDGMAAGVFRVETVTRVGYRMLTDTNAGNIKGPLANKARRVRIGRRAVVARLGIAIGLTGLLLAGGGAYVNFSAPVGPSARLAGVDEILPEDEETSAITLVPTASNEPKQAQASYGDLDLSTSEGRTTLDRRIKLAVDKVCGSRLGQPYHFWKSIQECQTQTMVQVGPQRELAIAQSDAKLASK